MSSFKLDRRDFLRGLAACLLLPAAIPKEAVEAATVTPEVWQAMELNPVTFSVNGDGRIGHDGYDNPRSRADAFSLSHADVETPTELLDTADHLQPLKWHLCHEYSEFWESLPPVDQRRWPEEPEEGVDAWVRGLDPLAFVNLRQTVHGWLADEPNYRNDEYEYFRIPASGDDYAFQFFNAYFPGDTELLGVIVIEGEHPGSSYYAAELTVSVAEANRRAEETGIPIRFTAESA